MTWLWAVTSVWLALGALLGVLIGRGIRPADRREAARLAAAALRPNFVVDEAVHLSCAQALIPEQKSASATEIIPSPRTAPPSLTLTRRGGGTYRRADPRRTLGRHR